jgi:hypothetical protein
MVVRFPLVILLIPLLTYAGTENHVECSDYYGLNICSASFELTDDQRNSLDQNQNKFNPEMEEHAPLFGMSLTDEDMDQLQKKNAFKKSDSFRAYMKTSGKSDGTSTKSEFSVHKKVLENTNFSLDCRLVTTTFYEISSSNYYDCALQRYF